MEESNAVPVGSPVGHRQHPLALRHIRSVSDKKK
jgi:hypothetical protein